MKSSLPRHGIEIWTEIMARNARCRLHLQNEPRGQRFALLARLINRSGGAATDAGEGALRPSDVQGAIERGERGQEVSLIHGSTL